MLVLTVSLLVHFFSIPSPNMSGYPVPQFFEAIDFIDKTPEELPGPMAGSSLSQFGHSRISGFGPSHIIIFFWPYHMNFISRILVIGPSMYMYIFLHVHTCIYIYIYVYTCVYMCIHMYVFLYIYIYICTYCHMYIHVYIYIYIYIYLYLYMYIIYVYTYVRISLYIYVHIVTCTYIYIYIYIGPRP